MNSAETWEKIGARIRVERENLRLTQCQLGVAVGLADGPGAGQAVGKWEHGTKKPDMEKLQLMCDLFGCELPWLLCGPSFPCKTRDISDIHIMTGLSERAIRRLSVFGNPPQTLPYGTPVLDILNDLLEDDDFGSTLDYMWRYVREASAPNVADSPIIDDATNKHREALEAVGLRAVPCSELARIEYETACELLKMELDRMVQKRKDESDV